jgi:tetrapyrrole methylase family protein/MazG family protein
LTTSDDLGQFSTLVNIIARLRAPDGCPWDRKQTHRSLREYILEECYEVLAALDEEDNHKLCGELGDLMLQIILQAQIAREAGEFDLSDVLTNINTKLIRRHPHIFGNTIAKNAEEVARNWEQIKREERGDDTSILASVSKSMPALAYSQEMQRRVAGVGFDWKDEDGVIDKLAEEIREFRETQTQEQRIEEFGDMLFTLANIARRMNIDLEATLREANSKFYRRFTIMEDLCRQRSLQFTGLSLDEQNALWEEAKRIAKDKGQ